MENADSPLSLPCKDLHGNVYPDNLYLSLLCLFPLFPYISLNKHIIVNLSWWLMMSVSQSHSHSISRPIRFVQFLREAFDWSASAELSYKPNRESTQLVTVTCPAISIIVWSCGYKIISRMNMILRVKTVVV